MFGLKWSNFFKDANGNESMTTLMLFLGFFPATYVLIVNQTENLYYAYLMAFTGLAANKQWAARNASNVVPEQSQTSVTGADTVIVGNNMAVSQPVGGRKVRK